MKKRMGTITIIAILIFLAGCSMKTPSEADLPSWFVDLQVPLMEDTFYADELLEDSLITTIPYGTQSDSIFAFQDTSQKIEKVEVGDQLEIDNIEQSFSQSIEDVTVEGSQRNYASDLDTVGVDPVNKSVQNEIGLITLNDTEPTSTDPIVFTEIIDTTGIEHGTPVNIPQSTPIPKIYRNLTFDDFEQAQFSDGRLPITIHNDLVIELGAPITVRLLQTDSTAISNVYGDTAKAVWDTGIEEQGGQATREIVLADQTLPGEIIIEITGVVCGSGSQTVTNNETTRNSSFYVEAQAVDLTVRSATAVIPAQTIDTTSTIELAESENKLKRATVLNGNLAIDITNNLPIDANLELTIYSIDVSETQTGVQEFQKTIPISANQTSNNEYSLTDKALVMQIDDQSVSYSYHIETVDTDPEKVQILKSDNVAVDISIYGAEPGDQITFSQFTGQVAQDPIVESGEIDITTGSKITSASISGGTISIIVNNGINQTSTGVPSLTLSLPELYDPGGNPIQLGPLDLLPGNNTININNAGNSLEGYTLQPQTVDVSPDSFNQHITYQTQVSIPSDEVAAYDLMDSIEVNIDISELIFSQVTGFFDRDAIVERDSINLEEDTKIDLAVIDSGELELIVENNIGAVADVTFQINEIRRKSDNAALKRTIHLEDTPEPITETISLDDYQIDMFYQGAQTEQNIHYKSTISIPSAEEMTLEFGRQINVGINMNNLRFQQVSGYIDTVEVDIDSVEQEIGALPDELEGIELNNVAIVLDFDTNIGIDFELDLTLMSYNDKGDTARTRVQHTIQAGNEQSQRVNIPNAEDLVNIKPSKILAYGSARIGGEGMVTTNQYIEGTMRILVPMEIIISDEAVFSTEADLVSEDIPNQIESVTITADINNDFDFGGKVDVLTATDTLAFQENSGLLPDTLVTIELQPAKAFIEEITLNKEKFNLFQDSIYIKPNIQLLGREDRETSKLMQSDSLHILLYGTLRGKVENPNKDEE